MVVAGAARRGDAIDQPPLGFIDAAGAGGGMERELLRIGERSDSIGDAGAGILQPRLCDWLSASSDGAGLRCDSIFSGQDQSGAGGYLFCQ
jgi:hypothetical protein